MAIETLPWDVTEHLDSPDMIAAYLDAALEESDAAFFRKALGDVARALGMSKVAADAGMSREALYKAFGDKGNQTLDTLLKVTRALGVRLGVAA